MTWTRDECVLLAASCLVTFSITAFACSKPPVEAAPPERDRFQWFHQQGHLYILTDEATGRKYLVNAYPESSWATPLLEKDAP